jgi:hypothetical protein
MEVQDLEQKRIQCCAEWTDVVDAVDRLAYEAGTNRFGI